MRISLHLFLTILCGICCLIAGGVLGALAALYTALALHAHGIDAPQVIGLLIMIGFPVAGAATGGKLGEVFAIRCLPARCPQCAGSATWCSSYRRPSLLRLRRRDARVSSRSLRYGRPITYFCRNCGYVHITRAGDMWQMGALSGHSPYGLIYQRLMGPDWAEQIKLEVALEVGLKTPTGVGSSRADASAVQSEMSKQAEPQQIVFLGVMGLICLAIGAFGISGAITDFRKVETTGVILETQIIGPNHTTAVWDYKGLIEYTGGDQVRREWLVINRGLVRDKKDRGRVGETRAVWYQPESPEKATTDRPFPWISVKGAAFIGCVAIAGVLCELAAGIELIRRWRGRRT